MAECLERGDNSTLYPVLIENVRPWIEGSTDLLNTVSERSWVLPVVSRQDEQSALPERHRRCGAQLLHFRETGETKKICGAANWINNSKKYRLNYLNYDAQSEGLK